MLNLLPNELWDYDPADAIRGIMVGLSARHADNNSVINIPGLGPAHLVRSARAAIVLALKALALRPGSWIGVPLYCCPVVFKAIKMAGCRARFIDVDPATYCMSATDLAAKSSGIEAVIAVHMFGNMCDMRRLQDAASDKQPFIEDCAQGLGSALDGRVAGSFGDLAVFSFRSGKYLSVGEGGAIYCNAAGLEARISESISALPVPGRVEECLHVGNTYLRTLLRTRPFWGLIGARLWDVYSSKVSYTSQSPLVVAGVYATDREAAIRRLPFLSSAIERQRRNADYYSRNLSLNPEFLCSETPGAFFNRFQFPILFPSPEHCEWMMACLLKDKISTSRPYRDIASVAAVHYGYMGDCPQAECIARSVLVIPCHHALQPSKIEQIASSVNRAWSKFRRRSPETSCLPS